MKKLIKILAVLIILFLLAIAASLYFLGSIVKAGVEKAGPKVTKTDVKLNNAKLSVFSGSGELKGFEVGNPEGYSGSAIKVGSVALSVQPGSVMSDKVVIHSVQVLSPEISFEGNLTGNNLSKLLDNIKGSSEKDKQATTKDEKSSQKKFQIDDFLITGAKVHVATSLLGGRAATLSVPEVHLTKLGEGADGITAAQLSEKVFAELFQNTLKAVTEQIGNIGKGATDMIKGATTNGIPNVDGIKKGVGDLFKKK
jgi:hypothetical protein